MNILILDMDGTVRIKKGGTPGDIKAGFIASPEDQEIIPGAAQAIESYHQQGWLIVGASNQGGVAAGKKTLESCFKEQQYTLKLVPQIDRIYFCPDYEGKQLGIVDRNGWNLETHFNPDLSSFQLKNENDHINPQVLDAINKSYSSFRKPEPGMIEYIKTSHECDRLLFVGDRTEDEQAAAKAGIDFQWTKDWWR